MWRCLLSAALLLAISVSASALPLFRGGFSAPTSSATVVSQIHNAPGWLATHAYVPAAGPKTRVVNGAAWNGTAFTSGAALNAYELTSGSCTSASSGGPSGVGAVISDGTCTWKYLSTVDYVTFTGWTYDGPSWVTGTTYHNRAYATTGSPLRSYMVKTTNGCTSTVAPTGTGDTIVTGDGCTWQYNADITYSSQISFVPTETVIGASTVTINMASDYEAMLWNDREYKGGANGETTPIQTGSCHTGACFLGDTGQTIDSYCPGVPCGRLIITAAPGESFADNLLSSVPLSGYDITKGVGLTGSSAIPNNSHQAILIRDQLILVNRLQFRGLDGDNPPGGIAGVALDGDNGCYGIVTDNIIHGGTSNLTSSMAFNWDCRLTAANNLIIAGGQSGFFSKYDDILLHNTIVCTNPAMTNSTAMSQFYQNYGNGGTTAADHVIVGCAHAWAVTGTIDNGGLTPVFNADSGHNVTSAPATDSGAFTGAFGFTYHATPLNVGNTFSVVDTTVFVAPGTDWRLKTGSAAAGQGANYGSFDWVRNCHGSGNTACNQSRTVNFDTPDMIGTARPGSTGVDPGAWQTP